MNMEKAATARVSALAIAIDSARQRYLDLQFGPVLGSGDHGEVFAATWKGAAVAVKVFYHQEPGSVSCNRVRDEIIISGHALHPNLVCAFQAFTLPMTKEELDSQMSHEKNCLKTFLVMERADDGPLTDRLKSLSETRPKVSGFAAILLCLLDVACGLEFLHSFGVTYGHLKLTSILCVSSSHDIRGFKCKLHNFGDPNESSREDDFHTANNDTMMYTSPQRMRGASLCVADDTYSFGMLAWHMLNGGDSYTDMPHLELRHQILEKSWRPQFNHGMPDAYNCMVKQSWAANPVMRPNFEAIRAMLTALLLDVGE